MPENTVKIPEHAREELTKLRCFLTGYHHGRGEALTSFVPGELIIRQLINAIDQSSNEPKA